MYLFYSSLEGRGSKSKCMRAVFALKGPGEQRQNLWAACMFHRYQASKRLQVPGVYKKTGLDMVVCACDVFPKLRHKNLCGVADLAGALSHTAHHPSQQH